MNPETIIAMDENWSQWRSAMHCVIEFVDRREKKVLDLEITEKQIGFIHGNHSHPSNGMEIEGIRRLIERWKTSSGLSVRALGYVHDRDVETRSLIRSRGDTPEFHDSDYVLQRLTVKFDAQPVLCELKSQTRRWFIFLIRIEESADEKIRL
jgi:hypothetical protein